MQFKVKVTPGESHPDLSGGLGVGVGDAMEVKLSLGGGVSCINPLSLTTSRIHSSPAIVQALTYQKHRFSFSMAMGFATPILKKCHMQIKT